MSKKTFLPKYITPPPPPPPLKVQKDYYVFPYDTSVRRAEAVADEIKKYERMGFVFIQVFNRGSSNMIYLLFSHKKTQ